MVQGAFDRVRDDEDEAVRPAGVLRVDATARGFSLREREDEVAVEEPLEIQIGGAPVAVLMRTPGSDLDLVRGFLASEGIVSDPGEIASVHHATQSTTVGEGDGVVRVVLAPGVDFDASAHTRATYASSSCGMCGKQSIERALSLAPARAASTATTEQPTFDAVWVAGLARELGRRQPAFARTGGLHAAALFDVSGACRVVREDIGRHNAVDKTIGWALARARTAGDDEISWPLDGWSLAVSGRVSFEIVQKAIASRVALVAGVSAPSSLAVDVAERAGIVLVGFLRDAGFGIYAGAERVAGARGRGAS